MANAKTEGMRERTRSALSSLSSIEEGNRRYAQLGEEIAAEAKEIGKRVLEGTEQGGADDKGGTPGWLGLPLLSASLTIDSDGVQGSLVAGRMGDGDSGQLPGSTGAKTGTNGPQRPRVSGYRIEFCARNDEALTLVMVRPSEVKGLALPEERDLFSVRVAGSPKSAGRIGRLVAKIEECKKHEQETRSFWGNQPADFALAWGALLWEDMKSLRGPVGKAELDGLEGELGEEIRKKSLVIERDAGAGRPDFSLCLPSYEVRFHIGDDGACRIRAIRMKKKVLFWNTERWIYKAEGEEIADAGF